jgi:hypothetical protein
MEKSLSSKSRVLQEYVSKKADFPTDYFGPDNKTLSSLPDYGTSNAALPRGEDPSVIPYKEKQATTQITKRPLTAKELLKEVQSIRASLNK